jgi:hypothetical protein
MNTYKDIGRVNIIGHDLDKPDPRARHPLHLQREQDRELQITEWPITGGYQSRKPFAYTYQISNLWLAAMQHEHRAVLVHPRGHDAVLGVDSWLGLHNRSSPDSLSSRPTRGRHAQIIRCEIDRIWMHIIEV